MKLTILFLVIAATITNLVGQSVERANTDQFLVASFPAELESSILAATFQIQVFDADNTYYEQGLASLVRTQEQTILVSHNHWDFLSSCSKVVILDAESQQLLTFECQAFKSLILYSSRGTLVLQAPEGLGGTPAELGSMEDIQPGKHVLIAHQNSFENNRLEVITGQIQRLDTFHQNRAMQLALSAEGMIRKGDSGGGIWVNGKLVGNLWAYKHELKAGQYFLDIVQTPIAAIIPLEVIRMISEQVEVSPGDLIEGIIKGEQ